MLPNLFLNNIRIRLEGLLNCIFTQNRIKVYVQEYISNPIQNHVQKLMLNCLLQDKFYFFS